MKKILALALLMGGMFAGLSAHAMVEAPVWNCSLSFKAKGGGLQVLVGYFGMSGTGRIRCMDVAGNTEVIPVRVHLGGQPLALNVGVGVFNVAGLATGIGLAGSPSSLLGTYYAAGAQAGAILGAGGNVGFHGGNGAATINVGFQVLTGLGAQIGLNRLTLSPLY